MRRMKAYARLAAQFLVACAMVFQQAPVAAFAQQAAAEGSAGAAQPAEQQEAAAPGAEETQPAEATAAEDAQPLDEALQTVRRPQRKRTNGANSAPVSGRSMTTAF